MQPKRPMNLGLRRAPGRAHSVGPWESDGRVAASGTVAPLMACPFKFNNFLNLKVARRDTPARCHTVCAASRPGQFDALAAWWAWWRRSELTALTEASSADKGPKSHWQATTVTVGH